MVSLTSMMPKLDEMFAFILIMVVIFVTTLIMIFLFVNRSTVVEKKALERTATELFENIASEDLTDFRAVFSASELDAFDMTTKEPYVRNCEYAYRMKVALTLPETSCSSDNDCKEFCMETCYIDEGSIYYHTFLIEGNCDCSSSDTCSCRKNGRWIKNPEWEFGFSTDPNVNTEVSDAGHLTRTFPGAISIIDENRTAEGYEDVLPAVVTLTVYDYWLSRILCVAEEAHRTGKVVSGGWIPCIKPKSHTSYQRGWTREYYECGFPVRKKGGDVNSEEACFFENWTASGISNKVDTKECRATDVPLFEFYHTYSPGESGITGDKGNRIIKAVPIKGDASTMQSFQLLAYGKTSEEICNSLATSHKSYVANGEPVGIVVLCLAWDYPQGSRP